ncbi:MAG TPA: InlB B-repeat-containing protein [Kofleriaceae bacterium]|nr:InlB B-repeat-containing protein [Kofleriaceae bacterium]
MKTVTPDGSVGSGVDAPLASIDAKETPTFEVTVTPQGNGTGTVTSSPSGLACGSTCSKRFDTGTTITLTASASAGSTFLGWTGGGCSGTGACTFTVTADTTVQASFSLDGSLVVTLGGNGGGHVTSSPSGIDCGQACSHQYTQGTVVTLSQTANADSTFTGWSGACSGTGACTVTMDQSKIVTATFALKTFTLSVTKNGGGAGTVTSNVGSINCGGTCADLYTSGTTVTLTASASAGSTFTGWSGACSGSGACVVTVSAATNVVATFTVDQHTLALTKNGTGAGNVTGGGLNCGGTCTAQVAYGTQVTLVATPSGGSTFAGWSGGGCSGTGTCVTTITADTNITATFNVTTYTLTANVAGNGSGSVSSSPSGISCPGTCSSSYAYNTVVTLTASASTGSQFTAWSGACAGSGSCVVTMSQAQNVTATFTLKQYTLSVTVGGKGSVTSSPAAINCPGTCSAGFNYGTSVTLTATPQAGYVFTGWSGACSGTAACNVTISAATSVTATFDTPNIVFVTSTTYTGNLGGLAGADAACQARANAAGLGGTFKAWLSQTSPQVNAISRLGAARGWARVDLAPVVDTTTDLANGRLYYPIKLDEFGNDLGLVSVITGTTANGTLYNGDTTCSNWTSSAAGSSAGGYSTAGSSMFTIYTYPSCTGGAHLYCFQTDKSAPLPVPHPQGRLSFVSNAAWIPGGGLASADALCQSDATAAGKSGTFLAALATSSASAASRFDLGGAPWVRADGPALAATAASLLTGTYLDVAFDVNAAGNFSFGNYGVWNGSTSFASAGTKSTTCNDWTDGTAGANGSSGVAGDTRVAATWAGGTPGPTCNSTYLHIMCLEK